MIFDPEGIHRAALNVVTNAIDAVSEKQPPGRVSVRTEYDAQNAKTRIIVEDDGPGIPADQMDFLFSPFISSKKSRGTGSGIAGKPKNRPRTRRPDPSPQRTRPRRPFRPGNPRHPARPRSSRPGNNHPFRPGKTGRRTAAGGRMSGKAEEFRKFQIEISK